MPSNLPPFRVTCWGPDFSRRFVIGDPTVVQVTPRYLAIGTGQVDMPVDHHRVPALMEPGLRMTMDYYRGSGAYSSSTAWIRLLSGPVWTRAANGPLREGLISFGVQDDYRLMSGVLAWPVPGNAINNQNAAYDKRTGPAETVIKAYVTANAVNRLGLPITVAPDQGRGLVVSKSARFETLHDLLSPVAAGSGLGMSLVQDDAGGLVFDVNTITDRSARVLSEASGTITDWSSSSTGPAATRIITGGQGEGAARTLRMVTAPGRETQWGTVAEAFVDATGADTAAELDQEGNAALADTAPTAGLSVTVAETDVVRYGRNLLVGDKVAVAITDEIALTDVLSEAQLSWTANEGLQVSPTVGDGNAESTDAQLFRAVQRMFTAIRSLRTSR